MVDENIKSSKQLSEVLNNPSISIEEKQAVLSKLFQNKLMPIVFNFITTLNLKGRLGILDAVAEEFSKELEVLKNILRVDITSAIELNDDKKNAIRGGLIFNINQTIVDNSIRHKLEDLKGQMALRR